MAEELEIFGLSENLRELHLDCRIINRNLVELGGSEE